MADIHALAETLIDIVRAAVAPLTKRIEQLESRTFEPGPKGDRGEPGPAGPAGSSGRDGLPGVPGQTGEKGLNGKDGRDGLDGLGFDDMQVEYDGERTFTFKFERGDQVKTFGGFKMPIPIYRGLFKDGQAYELGDTVTLGGSMWTALKDCDGSVRPDANTKDGQSVWRLSVMRGRQGTPGTPGAKGADGKDGRNGRDLTQMSVTGEKW